MTLPSTDSTDDLPEIPESVTSSPHFLLGMAYEALRSIATGQTRGTTPEALAAEVRTRIDDYSHGFFK